LKDLALHEAMWQITANEYLEAALRRMVHPIFAFTAIRILSCHPFDLRQDAHSHLPIIEAIKAKNSTAARKAFLDALDDWLSKTKSYVFGPSEDTMIAELLTPQFPGRRRGTAWPAPLALSAAALPDWSGRTGQRQRQRYRGR
jgi:hypothetical protein